jgi:hypothetical protein
MIPSLAMGISCLNAKLTTSLILIPVSQISNLIADEVVGNVVSVIRRDIKANFLIGSPLA